MRLIAVLGCEGDEAVGVGPTTSRGVVGPAESKGGGGWAAVGLVGSELQDALPAVWLNKTPNTCQPASGWVCAESCTPSEA